MGKFITLNFRNLDLSEEIINEIIILYSLGVDIEEIKYILDLKLDDLY